MYFLAGMQNPPQPLPGGELRRTRSKPIPFAQRLNSCLFFTRTAVRLYDTVVRGVDAFSTKNERATPIWSSSLHNMSKTSGS